MFLAGDHVQITPKGQEAKRFWAFVEGWTGRVQASGGGRLTVVCQTAEGNKTFYVEPENLTKIQ